jgi:electron transport complex protein RnfG
MLFACGGKPPIPKRGVVEGDLPGWKFKRFQHVLDIEVWVENNKAEAFAASYIPTDADKRGHVEEREVVNVFVTRYEKDDGVLRETVKLAVRLMAFALVSALLLAVVNALTKDTIAENELAEINAARAAVLGDYVFMQVDADLSGYVTIKDVYAGYDGDAVKGYVYEIQSKGYASVPVSISLGIDTSGAIVGLNITAHAETKGIGTDAQVPFLKSFVGLNAEAAGRTAVVVTYPADVPDQAARPAMRLPNPCEMVRL